MYNKPHAQSALEHLISALRDETVLIATWDQGEGVPRAVEYKFYHTAEIIASCTFDEGLVISEDPKVTDKIQGLIRSHVALYYTLYPGN